MPHAQEWIKEHFDVEIGREPKIPKLPTTFPESQLPNNIKLELESIAPVSTDGMDRLIRAHGQTLKDIYHLRQNSFPRIPDGVIWPTSHEEVSVDICVFFLYNYIL